MHTYPGLRARFRHLKFNLLLLPTITKKFGSLHLLRHSFLFRKSATVFFFLSKHITKWKTFWFLSYQCTKKYNTSCHVVIVRSTLQFCFGFTFFLCFYLKSGHSVKFSKDKLMIINNFTAWEIYFMHSDYTFIGNISDDNLNETRRIGVIRASVYYGIALCLH